MEERITPIWTTLWLVALLFSQPYMVVAVECFAGPISPMMVSLQERGRSVYCGDDLARDGAYNPVFGRGGVRPDLRASTELASPPFPSSPSGPRSSRKRTTIARRPAPTAASTALHSWRGGGGEVKGRMLLPVFQLLKLPAFVAQSKTRCFITLCASILGECVSTSLNKYSKVHGSPKALVAAMALYLMTVMGFNMALARIEVGVAYAIWSALGSLVVSTVGIVFFGESCDPGKLACLLLIVVGVVGLNLRG